MSFCSSNNDFQYGANEEGKLLNLMQTMCPFCRRPPTTKVLRRFNPGVAALGGLRDAVSDQGWYHAWCGRCGFAKRAYERQCCDGDRLPALDRFICEDCRVARPGDAHGGAGRLTACPSCGVMVEKEFGCNHITCQCGQHFCHVCGKGQGTAEEVYEHLSTIHGSIHDEDDEEDEEEF